MNMWQFRSFGGIKKDLERIFLSLINGMFKTTKPIFAEWEAHESSLKLQFITSLLLLSSSLTLFQLCFGQKIKWIVVPHSIIIIYTELFRFDITTSRVSFHFLSYFRLWFSFSISRMYVCIYIYTAVCKTFEPLLYIRIYIYGVHCGKVLILENVPGRKIILNIQPQEEINTQYIEDITCLPHYSSWK